MLTSSRCWWRAAAGLALAAACDGSLGTETLSVSRVEVAPATLALRTGESEAVTARVFDADGGEIIGSDVFWSAEDPAVATVTQTGLVTGVGTGETRIAASRAGESGIVTVTVAFAAVARVQVTPPTAIVPIGRTATFGVTLFDDQDEPLSTAGRAVAWSSERPNIATIDPTTGVATGVALGGTTIRAVVTTPGHPGTASGTATLTVTNVPVSRVTVAPATATVHVGAAYAQQFTATAFDDANNPLQNRQALWSSTNTAVASVGQLTGVVTGVAPGTARIRASVDGVEAFADVTVNLVPVADIDVSPGTLTLNPQQSSALTAVLRDASGAAITGSALGGRAPVWTSSATGVATVSNTGVVTGVSQGQATITAALGQASGSAQVTVAASVGSVALAISPDSAIGNGSVSGTATVTSTQGQPLSGRAVSVSLAPNGIAQASPASGSTNSSGQFTFTVTGTGSQFGNVVVTAQSGSASDQQTIRFLAPVTDVDVTAPQTSIVLGQGTLSATALVQNGSTPLAGRPVTVTSSDPSVATVSVSSPNSDGSGQVAITITPVAAGTTDIEATSEGITGSVTITVLAPVSTVTFSPISLLLTFANPTGDLIATVADNGGNPLPGRACQVSSQDTGVATVQGPPDVTTDSNGQVNVTVARTGTGSTDIVMICEGVAGSAPVTAL